MRKALHSRAVLALVSCFAIALTSSSCSDALGPNRGRVRLVLGGDASPSFNLGTTALGVAADHDDDDAVATGDRPSRWFQTANVTLSSVLVRNMDGVLVNLALDVPVTVDVVQLEHGRQINLPDGVLPVGEYDQVVIVMTAVRGVMLDGTVVTVEPPGGGWTATIPICPLEVVDGNTNVVGVDLILRNSFSSENSRFQFQPQFRAADDCVRG